jgi:polyhydroxybutyrate depolymerase
MSRMAGLSQKADREGFLVAYPNGSGRLPAVLTWNAGRCCGYAADQRVDDVAFVRAILQDVARATPLDDTRVFATGISNGGQMAYRLAAEMPDRIAGIAPVAASFELTSVRPSRPVPVVHFHGTNDEHLPLEGGTGRRSIAGVAFTSVSASIGVWTRANGCAETPITTALPDLARDGTSVERRAYLNCRDEAHVVLYLIRGGGHTWPGHPVAERLLGVTTRDIDATDIMWEFFTRSSRRGRS